MFPTELKSNQVLINLIMNCNKGGVSALAAKHVLMINPNCSYATLHEVFIIQQGNKNNYTNMANDLLTYMYIKIMSVIKTLEVYSAVTL